MGSFVSRQLRARLILPQGTFSNGTNTMILTGFRMSAKLERAKNITNFLDLTIYGMRQIDMNSVTVIFGVGGSLNSINTRALVVLESNDGSGWLQIFEGQVQQAQPDYRAVPDACLTLSAATGAAQQYAIASPSSFNGARNAAAFAKQLAQQMGFAFEDNMTSAGYAPILNFPYYSGTLMDQFRELAENAPFDYGFDAKGMLIVSPPNGGRTGKTPVAVNAQSGMIGYPTLGQYGLTVDVLHSPAYEMMFPIQVTGSDVPGTNGLWYPYKLNTEVESIKPGGKWQTRLECSPSNVGV